MAAKAVTKETNLKVLMTSDAVGGVWQYCVDLVQGLNRCGCEVLVANMGPEPSSEQKKRLLSFPHVTLEQGGFDLEWTANPWEDVDAAGQWLLRLASEFQPDIVHLNGYSHATLPWEAPVLVTGHSCVYSWWKAVHGCTPGHDWSEYHKRVSQGLAASDIVVAPSAFMAEELRSEYAVDARKLRVIHNFSQSAGITESTKDDFVLAAGRMWDKAKNLSLLNAIAPEIGWEVRVAGPQRGPQEPMSEFTHVHALGSLPYDELLTQMHRAAIFVHPALYEPFGLSVLDAALRSCCLVLSDTSSLRELWNGAAVFADPRKPEHWISEINALTGDESRRKQMGNLARKRARSYSADASVNAYLDEYKRAMACPREKKEVAA